MAAGDNSGRPPCLNLSGPGPLGNGQPSNSAYSMPMSNGGPAGATGGAQGAARRPNPQSGPGGGESAGVVAETPPTAHNAIQQALAQSASARAMETSATNMTSNASAASVPTTHSSLLSAPAAAAVLVYREPVYNWQATKSTVKERFAFLFNNEVLSDVHFLVGKGMGVQRIPAHR